jgi:hypothetical protein
LGESGRERGRDEGGYPNIDECERGKNFVNVVLGWKIGQAMMSEYFGFLS